MLDTDSTVNDSPVQRARYIMPANIFATKRGEVPIHIFTQEREQAFSDSTPTGLIPLDLSQQIGFDYAATTPFLLVRYLCIRAAEQLDTQFNSGGEIYYVIQGTGRTSNGDDVIAWRQGDIFCLPGGTESLHTAEENAVILQFSDEPLFSFAHAEPSQRQPAIETVHYPAAEINRELEKVLAADLGEDASGRAIQFVSAATEHLGTCMPSIALAVNTLEAGQFQRPHVHNSVALTLCLQGEGCYSMIDGQRVDWVADAVMVTPPAAVHSHHNDGDQMMKCLIAQDGGVYYHARTIGFSFAD